MIDACELTIDRPVQEGSQLRYSATFRSPRQEPTTFWYSIDQGFQDAIAARADPFVLGSLLQAMRVGLPLRVRGAPVSTSLLANLEEFQQAWEGWRQLHPIEIVPEDGEQDEDAARAAIAGFSGGVDSAFTVYRHRTGRCGRRRRPLEAALMVHGFDIPLDDPEGFQAASRRARRMLDSLNLELITVETNVRVMHPDWEDFHGLALASALTLLSRRFGAGLIAGSGSYPSLVIPWGSNPVTDWMMGSRTFGIIHDGAGATRLDKVRLLAGWKAAVENLRCCWIGLPRDRNCGQCLKCVLTLLMFRCLNVEPLCFDAPATPEVIRRALENYPLDPFSRQDVQDILKVATVRNITEPWVPVLRRALRRRPLTRRLRHLPARLAKTLTGRKLSRPLDIDS